jgi:amino acid transporter
VSPRAHNHRFILQGAILEYSLGRQGAVGISSLAIVAFVLQAVAQLQASSRFVFAIARDQALPFSDFFKQTNHARMPVHATWLVSSLTVPLAFALWQMPVLYSTFLSLGGGALCLLSYVSTAAGWDLTMTYQLRLKCSGRSYLPLSPVASEFADGRQDKLVSSRHEVREADRRRRIAI